MAAWLIANPGAGGPVGANAAADAAEFFESFGAFPTDGNRVLMENRNIAPTGDYGASSLPIETAVLTALDYFRYVALTL